MTMNRVIEYVDRIRPNIYTDDDKYLWLDKLEGLIAREVRKEDFPGYDLPREADLELAVPAPVTLSPGRRPPSWPVRRQNIPDDPGI